MDENNQIDPGIANDVLLSDAGNERMNRMSRMTHLLPINRTVSPPFRLCFTASPLFRL